jgi:hypothetical protein
LVYRNNPDPFLAIFHEARDRDVLFTADRAIDGPVELGFHAWDLDRDGTIEIIPYNVKVSLEGIPNHVWYREVSDKVICDEVVIYHVDQETINRVDQRTYNCWALSKDPSRILQVVYLSLVNTELNPSGNPQVHFTRPRGFVMLMSLESSFTFLLWRTCFSTTT